MAKQCKGIRPNPSGQPQEPCSHGPSRPVAAGAARRATSGPSLHASNAAQPVSIKRGHPPASAQTRHNGRNKNGHRMSHSFRRNERQEASKHRQHPIAKQTHHVPTDSNQNTYDANARAPRPINVCPAPRRECPKLGVPWDILGHFLPSRPRRVGRRKSRGPQNRGRATGVLCRLAAFAPLVSLAAQLAVARPEERLCGVMRLGALRNPFSVDSPRMTTAT